MRRALERPKSLDSKEKRRGDVMQALARHVDLVHGRNVTGLGECVSPMWDQAVVRQSGPVCQSGPEVPIRAKDTPTP
eukprot:6622450-Ditylum_brightwellii.AAC.1